MSNYITKKQIKIAEKEGACLESLVWLKTKKRRLIDIIKYHREWVEWALENLTCLTEENINYIYNFGDSDLKSFLVYSRNSTSEILSKIFNNKSICEYTRYEAITNSNFPINDFWKDYQNDGDFVENVIRNRNCSLDILKYVVRKFPDDRRQVMCNPNCSVELVEEIEALVEIDDYDRRSNPNLSSEEIKEIFNKGKSQIITHPNCPVELIDHVIETTNNSLDIEQLLLNQKYLSKFQVKRISQKIDKYPYNYNYHVRFYLVRHKYCPSSFLKKMSFRQSGDLRFAVANNIRTPISILEILKKDKNYEVAKRARLNLKYKKLK